MCMSCDRCSTELTADRRFPLWFGGDPDLQSEPVFSHYMYRRISANFAPQRDPHSYGS